MLPYLEYALVILAIWLIILTVMLVRTVSHYRRLTADVSKKDLVSALNHLILETESATSGLKKLETKVDKEIAQSQHHLQRIGFQRYNPFTDTGGDQSFTAALLDEKGNGIVISSLHSRENTRIYAKKLEDGKATNQVLSREELEVIKQALK